MEVLAHLCSISCGSSNVTWLMLVSGVFPAQANALLATQDTVTWTTPTGTRITFSTGQKLILQQQECELIERYQYYLLKLFPGVQAGSWIECAKSALQTTGNSNGANGSNLDVIPAFANGLTVSFLPMDTLMPRTNIQLVLNNVSVLLDTGQEPFINTINENPRDIYGQHIITPAIGWKHYILLGMDYTKSINSSCSYEGRTITLKNCYRSQYAIELKEADLPLLSAIAIEDIPSGMLPQPRSLMALSSKVQFLPPELCVAPFPTIRSIFQLRTVGLLPFIVQNACRLWTGDNALTKIPSANLDPRVSSIRLQMPTDQNNTSHTRSPLHSQKTTARITSKRDRMQSGTSSRSRSVTASIVKSIGCVDPHQYAQIITPLCSNNAKERNVLAQKIITTLGLVQSDESKIEHAIMLGAAIFKFVVVLRLLCFIPDSDVNRLSTMKNTLLKCDVLDQLATKLGLLKMRLNSNAVLDPTGQGSHHIYYAVVGLLFMVSGDISHCEVFIANTIISSGYASTFTANMNAMQNVLERVKRGEASTEDITALVACKCNVFCTPLLLPHFYERLKALSPKDLPIWYAIGKAAASAKKGEKVADVLAYIACGMWLNAPGFWVKAYTPVGNLVTAAYLPVKCAYLRPTWRKDIYDNLISNQIEALCCNLMEQRNSLDHHYKAANNFVYSLAVPIPPGARTLLVALVRFALTKCLYEKLEFLGDAFLTLSTTLYFHEHCDKIPVKQLKTMRQDVESNRFLGFIFRSFPSEIINVIKRDHPNITDDSKVYADIMEAVIAAILLACGEATAKAFVDGYIVKLMDVD